MAKEESINDEPELNPYEAPHYVEGEPEPLRKRNGVEVFLFAVNSLFCAVFIIAFLAIVIRPAYPSQRFGAIVCAIPLTICLALEFAGILSRRKWVMRVLGIAGIAFGSLFALLMLFDAAFSNSANPAMTAGRTTLMISLSVGFYFVLCGVYRLYRTAYGAVVPVAAPVEDGESREPASRVE